MMKCYNASHSTHILSLAISNDKRTCYLNTITFFIRSYSALHYYDEILLYITMMLYIITMKFSNLIWLIAVQFLNVL